jgi:uncharacterized protein
MARPGTEIRIREVPPPRSAPSDTGVWFVCGIAEKGPVVPTLIRSMNEYISTFGGRLSYVTLWDPIDVYFREGGGSVFVSRVVGPAAVTASRNLLDAGAAISLVVTAVGPGDWANDVDIAVVAGGAAGTFVLVIREANVEVERSPDLVDTAAAVAWGQGSAYVRITQGASILDPAVAAAALLTGGADDRAAITDTHWKIALDKFTRSYGPGQVSFPARTTTQAHTDLLAHAATNMRVAYLDLPDTAVKGTLITAAAAQRGLNARMAGCFAPWHRVPGIALGTYRTVPKSAIMAGITARNDVGLGPNVAAAGEAGESVYTIGLSQPEWTDADRTELNSAGVNVTRNIYGGFRNYGFRTMVDGVADPNWTLLGASRLIMEIFSKADGILERYVFDPIDGRGLLFKSLQGALVGMLQPYWEDDSLYGVTPDQAYNVDVGPQVNTPATIANNELHAVVAIRPSPMAEWVILELVKVPTTEKVA